MSFLSEIVVIISMLALNGVFVAFEMALASVSKARLMVLAGRKVKGADEALFMKENIEASFAVVQLGITVSTAIAAATGGLSASDSLAPWLAFSAWAILAAISAFNASRLKLAPRCMGG